MCTGAEEEGCAAGGKEATAARESAEGAGGRDTRPLSPISSPISGNREGQGRMWTVDLVGVVKAHTQQMGKTNVDAIKPQYKFS